MRKFLPILTLAFASFFIYSCDDNDDVVQVEDQDTIAQMRDITGNFNTGNGFTLTQGINILSTDVVLVYRNINSNTNAAAVWQLLPKTYFLSGGREFDYNFLFNSTNLEIFTDANFDEATMSSTENASYLTNQTFRIVLVPANSSKGSASVDYNDYNAVVKYYNLNDSKVQSTKFN